MSPLQRSLNSDVLIFRLDEEHGNMRGSTARGRGPNARTLIKNGPLRVTLITLPAGGQIAEHTANGPITVQTVSGSLRMHVQSDVYDLSTGDLLSLAPGIAHSVSSEEGATFLLTLAAFVEEPAG